jgi:hypothetical protein
MFFLTTNRELNLHLLILITMALLITSPYMISARYLRSVSNPCDKTDSNILHPINQPNDLSIYIECDQKLGKIFVLLSLYYN